MDGFKKFLSAAVVLGVLAGARVRAFDIAPIVIPVDREVTITIRGTDAEQIQVSEVHA